MANNATLSGQLNANDLIFMSGDIGATNNAVTRFDEYLITVDQPTANLTLTLTPTGATSVALVAANPEDGTQLAGSFNEGNPATSTTALISGQNEYRVILTTNEAAPVFPIDYKLQTLVDAGNVSVSSLTNSITGAPQSGQTLSLTGQLTDGDFLALPSAGTYSLADEYRVATTLAGETLTAQVSGTGFTPRLQIIDMTNGTIVDDVSGSGVSATGALAANTEYRVRVFSDTTLGEQDARNYNLVLTAPTGVKAAELSPSQGAGLAQINTPTQPAPLAPTAANTAEYASYNIGEQGSAQNPDSTQATNQFDLIGLSGGDDVIDLNAPPTLGTPQIFTDLTPAILPDGTPDYNNARWVVAFGGNDTFTGTAGNDVPLVGNQGNDTFNMGDGDDVAVGGADADVLNGEGGNDILNGNRGNDVVNGGDGNDILNGGADDDVLNGGAGQDTLSGDLGRDFLTGGANADTFVLTSSTATATAAEADVITDFSVAEADRIQLQGVGFADISLEAVDVAIDAGAATASTALKVIASGQYVGVVQGVTPFEIAEASGSIFV
ncbi:calcium-binding protein [Baaleninema sp.]|uniref:calcium-binding protein n=1 Tax=Baaleninema sp. TaxID=3101197 RepID=UPI003D07B4D9